MSASAEIHAQLASILERFAKRALLEMSRAVEQEMTRRQMEVETLLLKLQFTESELRSARQNQQNLRSVGTQASSGGAHREVSILTQEDGIKSVQIKEEHMEDGQWDGGPISPALCRLEDQDSFGAGSAGAAAVGRDFILTSKMKSSGMWNSPVSEEYPVNSGVQSLEASPLETGNLFHVVSFVDTEEVEAVPALWVKDGVCVWPPYKDEGVQRASECSEPPLDSWAAYNVTILHTARDYAEAQRKLALVEQQMDLQSGDETDAPKTRKHKTKRLLDDCGAEEENTRLTLDPQIQPPCKRSVLSAPDELQPRPQASAAPALPRHQRAVGSRRGVEPSAARPDASSHSPSPWLQDNSLSCGDPFVRSLLHDLTTKQEMVLEQQMSLMRMVQDLQAHGVREITDADGLNQRRFPLEDLRSLSALENELRSCPETRRKVFDDPVLRHEISAVAEAEIIEVKNDQISTEMDPQLRLDDNDQQISTPDPQLKPQESNKQVTSEAEQWSDGLVSCEADDGSQKNCKHDTMYSAVSSLDKCDQCSGAFSALTWIGVRCKICSCFWHTTCYNKHVMPNSNLTLSSDERLSSVELSDEEHIPDSCLDGSEVSEVFSVCELPKQQSDMPDVSNSSTAETEDPVQSSDINNEERTVNIDTTSAEDRTGDDPCLESSNESSSVDKKNYCYICGKPQSKFMRHLKVHEKTNAEVAQALALPTYSKERKKLLDKLRNKGNYKHNKDVLESRTGLLKLRRKPKKDYKSEDFVHCMYCHAMFLRRDLWRHVRNCASNPVEDPEPGRTRVLSLAAMSNAALCRQISRGVWKLLTEMKDDDVSAAVRSDFCILLLAQSFFNKHGQDPTKYDYIRQKLREAGRLLLVLQRDFSIQTLEDAVRPAHFQELIEAVRKVAGFDDEKHSHQTPSLALKLGHSLEKISSIIHCRALMAEDDEGIRSTQTFKKLYSTKWAELVSHTALTSLNEAHFNKPSTLPFTKDVQRLHQHLEEVADLASESLKKTISAQAYGELCKATLAKIILFNRRRGGEVSKMQLKSFLERDAAALHTDVAAGLTEFEQKLCVHYSRVEIRGKRGRKVAVLLSPDMVDALTHLVSRREECGVPEENPFLFGRPNCLTPYRGQDCLSIYANNCGAQNPEFLRSTRLRKHVATLSQLLNLENHQLEQVAESLDLDIRVRREYYRLPEATTQLAKISKLLLAMEKGALADLQSKTLEEIQVEDQLDFSDCQSEDSDEEETCPITGTGTTGPLEEHPGTAEGLSFSFTDADSVLGEPSQVILESAEARRKQKQIWCPAEISAVMRHFRNHVSQGKSASRIECQRCKTAEHPTLAARSAQNIRDFVRNRGVSLKRKLLKNV